MSSPYSIGVVVGSLRKDSFNAKLARAVERLAPPELAFKHIEIRDLPLYDQDDDERPHASVKKLKAEVRASDAIVFVTPEYNRSIPGVLKNALDHASRPYGQSAWEGKPAGILGISVGQIGTAVAQQHLRGMLGYLDMPTLGQPEVFLQVRDGLFDERGEIGIASTKQFLQKWMDRWVSWVQRHAAASERATTGVR